MSESELNIRIGEFLKSALRFYLVRNYNEAVEDLKAAEMLDRDNPEILYNLGINYCRMGLYKTAVGYFNRVVNLPQSFVDKLTVKKLMAYTLINMKKYAEAMEHIDDVLGISSADLTACNMKGYSLEKTGEFRKALEVYKSIIDFDKKNYNAYNSIAYVMLGAGGDPDECLKFAKIAVESDRKNPAYLDTLGAIYMKKGEFDKAGKLFQTALKAAPFADEIKKHLSDLNKIIKKK
ncbi:MAG: tetratricopeptide repeat protein [Spirochaetes bacterium]|jgi:tetratricopeptide (TPR) repeat protein|nr:tetratricopeptide repeat protein [Spirochaetota bacterium]